MSQVENEDIIRKVEQLLNSLSRPDLVTVNKMLIQRIKLMDDLKRLAVNSKFHQGQRVQWKDRQGWIRSGVILRINTKSISVLEDNNPEITWKISGMLLTLV